MLTGAPGATGADGSAPLSTCHHPHLLELSAWPWLERLSRVQGRRVSLASVPPATWDEMAARGFHFVFLMGVWQRSAIGREMARIDASLQREYDRVLPGWTPDDVAGSPYSVQDYIPDDRMGGWAGLEAARRELNARGIRLMLDFVPNHTSFDHPWISSHPERFVLGVAADHRSRPAEFRETATSKGMRIIACGRDPYFPPWRDVAQLNYFNPDTRAAMIGLLRDISAHCDGVRCDMAMLVLNDVFERTWRGALRDRWPMPADEFWPAATSAAPALTYLAEVYWDREWTLQQQGFDFTYDKRLLDRLLGASAADVRRHLAAEPEFSDRMARFLENHDEARSAAAFADRLPAAATLLTTIPGLRLFFDGQLEGRRIHSPVQLGRWPHESVDASVRALYDRLLRAAAQDLFHKGEWKLLEISTAGDETFADLIAYRWRLGEALAVIVMNLGGATAQGHVALAADLSPGEAFDFSDGLTDATYRWTREALHARGLFVRLERGSAHLMMVRRND